MKPILFNTEMVRAILDGRKTTTRRVVKPPAEVHTCTDGIFVTRPKKYSDEYCRFESYNPYHKGDVLYVRETFAKNYCGTGWPWLYKASPEYNEYEPDGWHPSIHMPKEASRIFLRVTGARAERLTGITENEVKKEGYPFSEITGDKLDDFAFLWNSTVKPADRDKYGWNANPWVWVIEFERCEKPEDGEKE